MDSPLSINNEKSKRIASNTIVLFVRMFVIMVINLYAVRVLLRALGEVDYGVFNTIAGVVLTSSFLITTLAISIQRFYSYALGERATERLSLIFTASMNIILVLVVIIVFFLETVGIWFVNTQLNIPPDRIVTVQWLFQFAIFTLVFSLVQIPYTAAIFAHEDMGAYAFISLFECLGRLFIAIIIAEWVVASNLFFYGAGLLVVAFLVFSSYMFYSTRHYEECHYRKKADGKLYKELLSFSGWTTYSTLSGMSIIQGNTILLNIFFGPVATASYAIANQIHNALLSLGNSIVIAFRPAMVKAYAEKDTHYLDVLFNVSSKSILYLMLCVSVPLIIEMPVILNLWLSTASSQMVLFSRLFVAFMILFMLLAPITTIIQSTGKIKRYTLWVDSITLLSLPLAWLLYHFGAPDYGCFLSMFVIYSIAHIVRLVCLKYYYPSFSYYSYFVSFLIPGGIVAALATFMALDIRHLFDSALLELFSVSIFTPLIVCLLAYFIGLSTKEKHLLRTFIVKVVKRRKS